MAPLLSLPSSSAPERFWPAPGPCSTRRAAPVSAQRHLLLCQEEVNARPQAGQRGAASAAGALYSEQSSC